MTQPPPPPPEPAARRAQGSPAGPAARAAPAGSRRRTPPRRRAASARPQPPPPRRFRRPDTARRRARPRRARATATRRHPRRSRPRRRPSPRRGRPPAQGPGYGYPQTPPPQPGYGYPGQPGQPQVSRPRPAAARSRTASSRSPARTGSSRSPARTATSRRPCRCTAAWGSRQPGRQEEGQLHGDRSSSRRSSAIALIVGGGVWSPPPRGRRQRQEGHREFGGHDRRQGRHQGRRRRSSSSGGSSTGGVEVPTEAQEKTPASTSAKILFQVPAPEVKDKLTIDSVKGSWLTDKDVRQVGPEQDRRLRPGQGQDASGRSRWPARSARPPARSPPRTTTVVVDRGGQAQDQRRPPRRCTEVAAFDLDDRQGAVDQDRQDRAARRSRSTRSPSAGTTVAAAGGNDGGAAFDLNTGKVLWTPKVGELLRRRVRRRRAAGRGPQVRRRTAARASDPDARPEVGQRHARSTRCPPASSTPGSSPPSRWSSAADVGDTAADRQRHLGLLLARRQDRQAARQDLRIPDDKYAATLRAITRGRGLQRARRRQRQVYLPTEEHDGTGEYSRTNEIVSFDLATGKPPATGPTRATATSCSRSAWTAATSSRTRTAPYDKGGQIVCIDGSTLQADQAAGEPGRRSRCATRDQRMRRRCASSSTPTARLFIGSELVSKPYSDGREGVHWRSASAAKLTSDRRPPSAVVQRPRPCSGAGPCTYPLITLEWEGISAIRGLLAGRGSATSNKRVASGGMKSGEPTGKPGGFCP